MECNEPVTLYQHQKSPSFFVTRNCVQYPLEFCACSFPRNSDKLEHHKTQGTKKHRRPSCEPYLELWVICPNIWGGALFVKAGYTKDMVKNPNGHYNVNMAKVTTNRLMVQCLMFWSYQLWGEWLQLAPSESIITTQWRMVILHSPSTTETWCIYSVWLIVL